MDICVWAKALAKLLDGPSVLLSLNLSDNQVRVPPRYFTRYPCLYCMHTYR